MNQPKLVISLSNTVNLQCRMQCGSHPRETIRESPSYEKIFVNPCPMKEYLYIPSFEKLCETPDDYLI